MPSAFTAPSLSATPAPLRTARTPCEAQHPAGAALIEVLIVILVISVMTSLAVSAGMSKMQKAGLARCFAELRSIQARISADSMEGGLPDPDTFWKVYWHGAKPGPYFYLVGDKAHQGASRSGKDVRFVVLCQHDHGDLALYVYVEDDGPPTVADAAHNPHYDLHLAKAGP